MKIVNTKGTIFYGMHFYPGLAQYQDKGQDPYRVFLNEDTIRAMDPTFAGRPIFVEHVDEVDSNLDELRKEADGWVVESFYNAADGKHWVKFIVVSDRGLRGIQNGMRLSNAYVVKSSKDVPGLWNGIPYSKEIIDAEFEHLAIVRNPRYEESVIMTSEQFKKYNEANVSEVKRIANSKNEGEGEMGLNFFKRAKVENELDLSTISVVLPKSGKEITITKLVNEADEKEMDRNSGLADMSHKVKMHDGSYCNVGDLLSKHKAMNDELESMKKEKENAENPEATDGEVTEKKNEDEKKVTDPKEAEDKEMKDAKKNELETKKLEAKIKADRLRNADLNAVKNSIPVAQSLELSHDRVALGKSRYGA